MIILRFPYILNHPFPTISFSFFAVHCLLYLPSLSTLSLASFIPFFFIYVALFIPPHLPFPPKLPSCLIYLSSPPLRYPFSPFPIFLLLSLFPCVYSHLQNDSSLVLPVLLPTLLFFVLFIDSVLCLSISVGVCLFLCFFL